jgi:hypothetical protein
MLSRILCHTYSAQCVIYNSYVLLIRRGRTTGESQFHFRLDKDLSFSEAYRPYLGPIEPPN